MGQQGCFPWSSPNSIAQRGFLKVNLTLEGKRRVRGAVLISNRRISEFHSNYNFGRQVKQCIDLMSIDPVLWVLKVNSLVNMIMCEGLLLPCQDEGKLENHPYLLALYRHSASTYAL